MEKQQPVINLVVLSNTMSKLLLHENLSISNKLQCPGVLSRPFQIVKHSRPKSSTSVIQIQGHQFAVLVTTHLCMKAARDSMQTKGRGYVPIKLDLQNRLQALVYLVLKTVLSCYTIYILFLAHFQETEIESCQNKQKSGYLKLQCFHQTFNIFTIFLYHG